MQVFSFLAFILFSNGKVERKPGSLQMRNILFSAGDRTILTILGRTMSRVAASTEFGLPNSLVRGKTVPNTVSPLKPLWNTVLTGIPFPSGERFQVPMH